MIRVPLMKGMMGFVGCSYVYDQPVFICVELQN